MKKENDFKERNNSAPIYPTTYLMHPKRNEFKTLGLAPLWVTHF